MPKIRVEIGKSNTNPRREGERVFNSSWRFFSLFILLLFFGVLLLQGGVKPEVVRGQDGPPPSAFAPAEGEFIKNDTTYGGGKSTQGGIDETLAGSGPVSGAVDKLSPGSEGPTTPGSLLENPLKANSLGEFLTLILDAIVLIAFPFLVLMLVYAGFLFVQAQGNEQKLQEARRTFMWTLLGALLVLGAQALSLAIKATVDEIQVKSEVKENYDFSRGSFSP